MNRGERTAATRELAHLLAEGSGPWEFVQDDVDLRLYEARVLNSRNELVFRGHPCDAALAVAAVNKALTLTALTDEDGLPAGCAGEGYPGIAHDLNEARRAETRAVEQPRQAGARVSVRRTAFKPVDAADELAAVRSSFETFARAAEEFDEALLVAAEAGASLRQIGEVAGASASTVLRAVRRAEERRKREGE